MYEKYQLKKWMFLKTYFDEEISSNCPNDLFKINVHKILELC